MDDALSQYLRALADPEIPVSLSAVEQLLKDYPFFTLPALTLMQREGAVLPEETRRRLLEHIALNAPDPAAFAALSDSGRDTWTDFYPAEHKKQVTTENVIDTFLATYGHSSPQEDALLERLIFNPTADYSVLLAREEEQSLPDEPSETDNPQDPLINSFILKQKSAGQESNSHEATGEKTAGEKTPGQETPGGLHETHAEPMARTQPSSRSPEAHVDSSLSESLAKIYIRRRRYDKAFEIIHGLSLNNPKKSVYFADQLRFLRKLMLNSSLSEKNKPSN